MVQPHHRRKLHRGRQDPFPPHRERGAQAGGTSKGVLTSGAGIQLKALCGTILLSRHGLVLRERLNDSQGVFAALLRTNVSTLRNWEQDRARRNSQAALLLKLVAGQYGPSSGLEEPTMQTHSAKQEALEAIQRLPDTADMEEIMYRLYVLENIRHGQHDAAEGKTQPAEELLMDVQSW